VIRGRSRLQSCKRSREAISGLRRQDAEANIGAADDPKGQAAGCGAFPSAFVLQRITVKTLDSRFRGNDENVD
jgi:hypothetical protein